MASRQFQQLPNWAALSHNDCQLNSRASLHLSALCYKDCHGSAITRYYLWPLIPGYYYIRTMDIYRYLQISVDPGYIRYFQTLTSIGACLWLIMSDKQTSWCFACPSCHHASQRFEKWSWTFLGGCWAPPNAPSSNCIPNCYIRGLF